jgi:hypothetical protein
MDDDYGKRLGHAKISPCAGGLRATHYKYATGLAAARASLNQGCKQEYRKALRALPGEGFCVGDL